MESNFLTKLELLNNTGYFTGLNPKKFYEVLKYNYETGNDEEKKFMDDNMDLYLDRYKTGVMQTNLTYQKINAIYGILVFFLILTILSAIANFIMIKNFYGELEPIIENLNQFYNAQ